jgi:hypothetical protein
LSESFVMRGWIAREETALKREQAEMENQGRVVRLPNGLFGAAFDPASPHRNWAHRCAIARSNLS